MLECLICFERYRPGDVSSGLYRIETHVCSRCYAKWQKMPHERSCWGKPDTIDYDGRRLWGFSADAIECSEICPDRVPCKKANREKIAP